MRRAILVAGCLSMLLGAAWWVMRDSPESSVVLPEVHPAQPAGSAAPGESLAQPEASLAREHVALAAEARETSPVASAALLVQVVDAAGIYASGVPIGIRKADDPRSPDILSALTEGKQGIARFDEPSRRLAPLAPQGRFFVHLAIAGCFDIGEILDLEDMPRESLLLRLPPCGSVTIRVHDSEGTPLRLRSVRLGESTSFDDLGNLVGVSMSLPTPNAGSTSPAAFGALAEPRSQESATAGVPSPRVSLVQELSSHAMPEGGISSLQDFGEPLQSKPQEAGLGFARFLNVPLGLDLTVHVITHQVQSEVRSGPGPRQPGEDVTIEFDMGAPLPVLVGRLIDDQAAPVADCSVQYNAEAHS
ncbi:MAG: hypothetical protein ABIP42_01080, partial [Planctomycetota bacterium]